VTTTDTFFGIFSGEVKVRGAISADGRFAAGVAGSTRKTAPKNTNGIRVKIKQYKQFEIKYCFIIY
jgi:hypothetical protein